MASPLLRVLRAELEKYRAQRIVVALAVAVAASPLLVGIGLRVASRLQPDPPLTGFYCFLESLSLSTRFLTLATLLLGALSVAQERTLGTITPLLAQSVSRTSVLLGKGAALALVVVVLYFVVAGVALGTSRLFFAFEPVTSQGYVMQTVGALAATSARAVLLTLPALLATAAFGFALSTASSGTAGAVVATLLAYTPLVVLPVFFRETAEKWVLFSAYTTHFLDGAADLARGYSITVFDGRLVTLGIVVPTATAIGLGFAALGVFRRSDVLA